MAGLPSIMDALELHQAGDLPGARAAYQKILDRQPYDAMATHYLGVIAHQSGQWAEALRLMDKSIAASPQVADFHCNRGLVLRDQGRLAEAAAALCQAIRLQPKYPQALNNLGDVLRQQGRLAEAHDVLRQAIAIEPSVSPLKNLGLVLIDQKRYAEAAKALQDALKISPQDQAAWKYLSIALRLGGQLEEALAASRAAVAGGENDADAWFGLAQALRETDRLSEAVDAYRRALELSPEHPDVLIGLGAALNDLGELNQAIEVSCRAVARRPASHEARYNLSLSLLGNGRFSEGWKMYEARWGCPGFFQQLLLLREPVWDGSDPAGRTIFIRAEQGCGDTIQFARYVPMLAERGAKVILECQAELKTLLSNLPGVYRVIARGEEPGEFDCHLPLLSLPLHFQTTQASVPADVPYLRPDPGRIEQWRLRLANSDGLKCGLVWAGSKYHRHDRSRSLPSAALSPLLQKGGVRFFSFQKDCRQELPDGMTDLSPDLHDFSDTAAALTQMDLLISVDTSVAHLAGALGRPVWTLLPHAPDWRWMQGTECSAWYPTMRLFRQQQRGEWGAVMARVGEELQVSENQRRGGRGTRAGTPD